MCIIGKINTLRNHRPEHLPRIKKKKFIKYTVKIVYFELQIINIKMSM